MKRELKFVKRHKKIRNKIYTPIKCNLNKGDTVMLMVGDDKKKTGVILNLKRFNDKIKALVSGLNVKTHFTKDGIIKKESYIDISNLCFFYNNKPCRVNKKAGGIRKVSTGEIIPVSEFKAGGKP